ERPVEMPVAIQQVRECRRIAGDSPAPNLVNLKRICPDQFSDSFEELFVRRAVRHYTYAFYALIGADPNQRVVIGVSFGRFIIGVHRYGFVKRPVIDASVIRLTVTAEDCVNRTEAAATDVNRNWRRFISSPFKMIESQ